MRCFIDLCIFNTLFNADVRCIFFYNSCASHHHVVWDVTVWLRHGFTVGEACWWTIHPASKQRSEGEKVRVGDDLILVSVSSERYLVGHVFILFHIFYNFFLSDTRTRAPSGIFQTLLLHHVYALLTLSFCDLHVLAASVLCQRGLDGRCVVHANFMEHESSVFRLWASRGWAI